MNRTCKPLLIFMFALAQPIGLSHASAIANLSVSALKVTLNDLDLTDGFAPELIFDTSVIDTGYLEQRSRDPYYWVYNNIVYGSEIFSPINNSLRMSATTGSFNFSGDPYSNNGAQVLIQSTAEGTHGRETLSTSGILLSRGNLEEKFLISPHTELLITALVDLDVSAGPNELAYSRADFALKGDATKGDYQNSTSTNVVGAGIGASSSFYNLNKSISVSFLNNSQFFVGGYISGYMQTVTASYDEGVASTIPEPRISFLMMFGTLCLLIKTRLKKMQSLPSQ